jgi:hypothetical protein
MLARLAISRAVMRGFGSLAMVLLEHSLEMVLLLAQMALGSRLVMPALTPMARFQPSRFQGARTLVVSASLNVRQILGLRQTNA